jgi:ABC-2 type transport system ATP-binding protein
MTVVSFDAVGKSYGDVHALRDVTFEIQPGELVAVLGPNGAGKTTAFEVLLGLGRPSTGQVRVYGRAPGSRAVVGRVGAMLQNAGLQETVTVRDVVGLIAAAHSRSLHVDEVLERTGMTRRADRTVSDLSGGERQRLLLAMAIIGQPDLLVLDEPTAAMDVAARRTFWDEAKASVGSGTTMMFATHNLAEADEVADRVIVLKDGEIVADATPGDLKQQVHGKVTEFVTNLTPGRVEALLSAGTVELVTSENEGWHVRVHSNRPAEAIAALISHGGRVDNLVVRDADLEDAFIELMGARS